MSAMWSQMDSAYSVARYLPTLPYTLLEPTTKGQAMTLEQEYRDLLQAKETFNKFLYGADSFTNIKVSHAREYLDQQAAEIAKKLLEAPDAPVQG